MNNWCQNLGTDDNVVIETEHPDCNDLRYARLDGSTWHCFFNITDTVAEACVTDTGRLINCYSGDFSEDKCTRDAQLKAHIAEGCLDGNLLR